MNDEDFTANERERFYNQRTRKIPSLYKGLKFTSIEGRNMKNLHPAKEEKLKKKKKEIL